MRTPLALALVLCTACARAPSPPVDPRAQLTFTRDGSLVRTLDLAGLQALTPSRRVTMVDPYYQQAKTFLALELAPLLEGAFGLPRAQLAELEFTLRASDGYTVPVSGASLLEPGAFLAYADADGPWQPIGPKRADPSPFYLVWALATQQDLENHPRPWALERIAIEPFEAVFPKLRPPSGASAQVERGYGLFRARCVRCHALDGQGGKVGPELNAPRNITDYRTAAFLKEWIRDASAFRPTVMPAFPLSEAELDELLAYLAAMRHPPAAQARP